jgi:hypothetical protein
MEMTDTGGVFHHVTPPPTEIPLARAEAHLQAGRVAEAAGAYRAVLLLDPTEARAHLGLAECALARGATDEAAMGLAQAAAELGAAGETEAALHLLAGALTISPTRLELHLEVAELEVARGLELVAATRLRALADAYRHAGREDDAAAIGEFASGMPTGPMPKADSLLVALPQVQSSDGPTRTAAHRALRRAVRWQPGGSPGRASQAKHPPPPPSKPVRSAARRLPPTPRAAPPPLPTTPRPVKKASATRVPPAPSPLAQRLRSRPVATPAPPKPAPPEDTKQRLASRLAKVTAKHKPHLAAPPRKSSAAPLVTALEQFEEARTRLFRRPLTAG